MANSLIVRLNGDSSNLENALNSAREGINNLTHSADKLTNIQDKFKRITESSAPLRKKIADIKKAMEQMAVQGLDATEEGKEMWERLAQSAKEYDKMLKRIQNDTRSVGEESKNVSGLPSDNGGGMLSNVDFGGIGKDLLNKSGLGGVAPALGAITGMINPVTVGLTAVGGTMIAAGKATAEFETHLNSLQALTGLTDNEMKSINDGAIEMSKNFKSSAGDIVDSMKLIGSQAPQLLSNKEALMEVTEAANVLAEAAEIEVVDAAKGLTTVMNQMGVDASKAGEIINVLAASSQKGSADVAYLNTAFEKAGTVANNAGLSYQQLAAAVETIAPKFGSADQAGTSLAATFKALEKQADNSLKPSVVGIETALDNLAKKNLSTADTIKTFGDTGYIAADVLIKNREAFSNLTNEISGTQTAYEQMEINQKGFEGSINKLKSAWEAFLLTLGQSGIMQGITDNIITVINAINEIINVISDVIKSFEAFGDTGVENVNLFKIQIDYLIGRIKCIGEIIEVVVRLIAKAFNGVVDVVHNVANSINNKWQSLKKSLGDIAFVRTIINAFNKVLDAAANMVKEIKRLWNKLKEFLGMSVETNIDVKTNKSDSNISNDNSNNSNSSTPTSSTGGKSGKTKSGSKSTKTEKIDYLVSVDDKTLDTAEKKLQAWQSKLKITPTTDKEAIKKCKEEIEKWKKEVENRKLLIGTEIEEGSKTDLENKIKQLEEVKKQLYNQVADPTEFKKLEDEIKALKKQLENEEIRLGIKPFIEIGSLNEIKKKITEKQKEIELALNTNIDPESMKKLQSDLEKLRKEEEAKEIELGLKYSPTIKRNEEKQEKGSLSDIQQSKQNAMANFEDVRVKYKLGLIGKEEAEKEIAKINEQLQGINDKEIKVTINDDGQILTKAEQMQQIGDIASNVGNSFNSLGSALNAFSENEGIAKAALIAQAIGQLTLSFAGAMKGTFTPWDWIAGAVSGVAVLTSTIAQISKFENGGIVGGNSYYGDKILARVNSGELILNRNQQAKLYDTMNQSTAQPLQNTLKGDVKFELEGSKLKGCLNNYNSKMGRIK